MANAFDIRQFFRRAPHDWLKRYFDHAGVLHDFDWGALPKRKIDALVSRWHEIDETQQRKHVEDFRNIKLLATAACKVQIIDEAGFKGRQDEIAAELLDLGDFYACAFWTLLEQPELWEGALRFAVADRKSKKYWRKRINMPRLGRHPTEKDARALETALSTLFKKYEARGSNCVVNVYRRGADGKREYFFAYPEDHRHTPLVFDKGELVAQPHNPAFELIFVHNDDAQTLDIWHEGDKERIRDLQVAFAQAVLGTHITRDSPKDDRAYDLRQFLNANFTLKVDSALGIETAELRRMRVRIGGRHGRSIVFDLDTDTPSHLIHEDLAAITARVPLSQLEVTQVGLRVIFDPFPIEPKSRSRTFHITSPNSCNLKFDEMKPLIERLLIDNAIEPRAREGQSDDQAN